MGQLQGLCYGDRCGLHLDRTDVPLSLFRQHTKVCFRSVTNVQVRRCVAQIWSPEAQIKESLPVPSEQLSPLHGHPHWPTPSSSTVSRGLGAPLLVVSVVSLSTHRLRVINEGIGFIITITHINQVLYSVFSTFLSTLKFKIDHMLVFILVIGTYNTRSKL